MRQINKQKGFSGVIVLMSLLLLVAVGFTGYYVWNQQNNNKVTGNSIQQEKAKTNTVQKTDTKPSDTQKYLVIKEWGVQFPINSELKDIYYKYEKTADVDNVKLFISDPKVSKCLYVYNILKSTMHLEPNTSQWGSGDHYASLTSINNVYYVGSEEDGPVVCYGGVGEQEMINQYGKDKYYENSDIYKNQIIEAAKKMTAN